MRESSKSVSREGVENKYLIKEERVEKFDNMREAICRLENMGERMLLLLERIRGVEGKDTARAVPEINCVADVLNNGPQRINSALDEIASSLEEINIELF